MTKKQHLAQIERRMLLLQLRAELLGEELKKLAEIANEMPADWKEERAAKARRPLPLRCRNFSSGLDGFDRRV